MEHDYQGSCLCGTVRYALACAPKAVTHCHCRQCRKGHGAAFASYASVPREALQILGGIAAIRDFQSSAQVVRQFCGHCGSTLFWSRTTGDFAGWVSVALGTLDTHFVARKHKHVHGESAAAWAQFNDPAFAPAPLFDAEKTI
ncbi:GFA family protein [Pseudomonas xantholysinigenes]|uniref:GFA family protein n=1 Tax=Pseudomonas xantholysinigenes TaxID=2745490 RepID=A0A9E6PZZ2_9PSED|nr:GFA family protein [Pseudomonas xantholysinigenes]QXI40303.1 GFA family protein [Pseudomonas xantholysinigenes]